MRVEVVTGLMYWSNQYQVNRLNRWGGCLHSVDRISDFRPWTGSCASEKFIVSRTGSISASISIICKSISPINWRWPYWKMTCFSDWGNETYVIRTQPRIQPINYGGFHYHIHDTIDSISHGEPGKCRTSSRLGCDCAYPKRFNILTRDPHSFEQQQPTQIKISRNIPSDNSPKELSEMSPMKRQIFIYLMILSMIFSLSTPVNSLPLCKRDESVAGDLGAEVGVEAVIVILCACCLCVPPLACWY
jgi:hypothetical protein